MIFSGGFSSFVHAQNEIQTPNSLLNQPCVVVYVLTLWELDLFPHDHPSAATTVSDMKRQHVSFYACRDTQSKRMIEINLCVLPGLSRGNQSWLNYAPTSISVRGNSSCYLIWLHNRKEQCWDCLFYSAEMEKCSMFVNVCFFMTVLQTNTHTLLHMNDNVQKSTCLHTHTDIFISFWYYSTHAEHNTTHAE